MVKAKATPKLISGLFYASHALLMILAVGFGLCGIFTGKAETQYLGKFNLKITEYNVDFCYVVSGCLVLAAGLGIVAQLLGNKACLWILYCGILGFLSLGLLSEGIASLGKASTNMKSVKTDLRNIALEPYYRDPNFHVKSSTPRVDKRTAMGKAWDETQKTYKVNCNCWVFFQNLSFCQNS